MTRTLPTSNEIAIRTSDRAAIKFWTYRRRSAFSPPHLLHCATARVSCSRFIFRLRELPFVVVGGRRERDRGRSDIRLMIFAEMKITTCRDLTFDLCNCKSNSRRDAFETNDFCFKKSIGSDRNRYLNLCKFQLLYQWATTLWIRLVLPHSFCYNFFDKWLYLFDSIHFSM